LTICPVPERFRAGKADLEKSLPGFPLVGLLIGGLLSLLDAGLRHFYPLLLVSVILVIVLLLVSGCMHGDGLADTADGFFSSQPRERILEIMKDSRTGPMGVMAIVSVLILKAAALTAVPAPARWWALLLTPLAAYSAIILNVVLLPYARPEGGLGKIFGKHRSMRYAAGAVLVVLATGWLAGRMAGLTAAAGALVAGLLFAAYSYRKIGGYTGDTLGAVHELSGIIPALVVAAWSGAGGSV
jgi:adenosylcobinamide-GDP ribazoletransferase